MIPYDFNEFAYYMVVSMTILGITSILAGIFTLVTRASGKAVQTIANQAARLGQKGIVDDIAGLVGNASSLVDALNQLVKTNAGIGIFLLLFGFVMLVSAFVMVKIY